jgi:hypothetical protein
MNGVRDLLWGCWYAVRVDFGFVYVCLLASIRLLLRLTYSEFSEFILGLLILVWFGADNETN